MNVRRLAIAAAIVVTFPAASNATSSAPVIDLSNSYGLPLSTGITGLGSGTAAALGNATNVFGGLYALGNSSIDAQVLAAGRPNVAACLSPTELSDFLAKTLNIPLDATLQTCMDNAGPGALVWPSGSALLATGGLIVPDGQFEIGTADAEQNGTGLYAKPGVNAPLIRLTHNSSGINGFAIIGSSDDDTTSNQHCVSIEGANLTRVENSQFARCYDGVYSNGTAFYTTIANNTFSNLHRYAIHVDSATAPGFDGFFLHNRFVGGTSNMTAVWRLNGLGSLISVGNQISTNAPSGPVVWLENPAQLFGGYQATNDVYENATPAGNAALYIQGASAASGSYAGPWSNIVLTNVGINGGNGNAIKLGFTRDIRVIGGILASSASGTGSQGCTGIVTQESGGLTRSLVLSGVSFDHNFGNCASPADVPLVTAQSGSTIGVSIFQAVYSGGNPLLDLTALPVNSILHVDVIGGQVGTNSVPVRLPTGSDKVSGTIAYNNVVYGRNGTFIDTVGNSAVSVGQDATHSLQVLWGINSVPNNAVAHISTYGDVNPIFIGDSPSALVSIGGGYMGNTERSWNTGGSIHVPYVAGQYIDNAVTIRNDSWATAGTCGNAALRFVDNQGRERGAAGYSSNNSACPTSYNPNTYYIEIGNINAASDVDDTNFAVINTHVPGQAHYPGTSFKLIDVSATDNTIRFRDHTATEIFKFIPEDKFSFIGDSSWTNLLGNVTGMAAIDGTRNTAIVVGQDSTHAALFLWAYNSTPANSFAEIDTWGGTSPFKLNPSGGPVQIGGPATAPSIRLIPTTVSSLGNCNGGTLGTKRVVSDGDSGLAWGATVVNSGSGSTAYEVSCLNGSSWSVVGK